jgi:hypothetical protein
MAWYRKEIWLGAEYPRFGKDDVVARPRGFQIRDHLGVTDEIVDEFGFCAVQDLRRKEWNSDIERAAVVDRAGGG